MIHNFYKKAFSKKNGYNISLTPDYAKNTKWLNILKLDFSILKKDTLNKIIKRLRKSNIETRSVWYPNHMQKKFKSFQKYKIVNAQKLVKASLCLPSSTNLKKKELLKIAQTING